MGNYLKSNQNKSSSSSNNNNKSYFSVASVDSRSEPTDTTSILSQVNKSNPSIDTIIIPTSSVSIKNNTNKTANILSFRKEDINQLPSSSSSTIMSVILKPTVKQTASVIFLHGLGDTGHGWSAAFNSIKKPHIKYVFPTAPVIPVTLNGGFRMNAWFDIFGLSPDAGQDEAGIKNSSQILLNLVQEEINSGIPSESIYIGGFSQGGATALYTALTSSFKFAGVIALSTWLPLHHRFPQELAKFDNKLKTPFLQCHGDSDPMVPLQWSKMTVDLMKSLGFETVNFKIYPGLSHSSTEEELDDVNDFIVKHLTAQ